MLFFFQWWGQKGPSSLPAFSWGHQGPSSSSVPPRSLSGTAQSRDTGGPDPHCLHPGGPLTAGKTPPSVGLRSWLGGRGRPGREPTLGPRVSPGSHGRAEGSPTAPPVPRLGLSRSPQPYLQVGKLRHGNGQRLFCQSTDLTSTGWPSSVSHRQGHIPTGAAAGWRGGSDAGGGTPGGTGHGPALAQDPLESRALVGPAGSSPAEEHGRSIRLRSPPSPGRAGMETSQPPVEKLRGSLLENSVGKFFCVQTPSLGARVEKCKTAPSKRCPRASAVTNAPATS